MDFLSWLFGTRPGVLTLVLGGVLFFLLLAFLLERRTHKVYFNHEKPKAADDEWDFDIFDDDEVEEEEKAEAERKAARKAGTRGTGR